VNSGTLSVICLILCAKFARMEDVASIWGTTPRHSIEAAAETVGDAAIVDDCLAILAGRRVDDEFLYVIAGPGARTVLSGREGGPLGYWPRTWALRALLYVWDDRATGAVVAATEDEAWRVREMAAKVVAKHRLDDGLEAMLSLRADPVERVRAAAARARQRLTEGGS
jgi:hypothetical protein